MTRIVGEFVEVTTIRGETDRYEGAAAGTIIPPDGALIVHAAEATGKWTARRYPPQHWAHVERGQLTTSAELDS